MVEEKRKRILHRAWRFVKRTLGKITDVYFISGMCYNCSVFDDIELPKGYKKKYIEWLIPHAEESLEAYAHRMSESINTKRKFILVGYSLGGVVAEEIAYQLHPKKIVLISTMKDEKEIPSLFHMAAKVNFANNIPMRMYKQTDFMIKLFNRYVYNLPTSALEGYMTVTDPIYIKWALHQITHWKPKRKLSSLYHIHGTKDQIFPHEQIINPISIKGGDHLMVIKRAKEISEILKSIMLK